MKAVILKGNHSVQVDDVPVPELEADTDVLVKVHLAGLCGSDLHFYRGKEGPATGFTLGHEFVGSIVRIGTAVQRFKLGDVVLAPFSLSCGACFYCMKGHTSRCLSSISLGTGVGVPGAQAEYIRIPMADACVFPLPRSIPPHLALLLADVLPTGYMTAHNALSLLSTDPDQPATSEVQSKRTLGGACVVVGCGPVGLCAIIAARTMFATVFATDPSEGRRAQAAQYGATALPADALRAEVLAVTEGRGADAALEVVGNGAALRTAMSLVRPYGVVSSCGVHGQMDMDGELLYGKNLRLQFGRCSVRRYFEPARELLQSSPETFADFIQHQVPLDEAEEWYRRFEKGEVGKTVFEISPVPL